MVLLLLGLPYVCVEGILMVEESNHPDDQG